MLPTPDSVFRAYDIRGIAHREITPDFMRQLGRAFAITNQVKDIVVGYDARPSSKEFLPYFLEGLTEQGADVRLVGMMPSEVVIACACINHISHAAILTASHNPAEYVGVKLFRDGSTQIGMEQGQQEIRAALEEDHFSPSPTKGTVHNYNPWPEYLKHLSTFLLPHYEPRKIVVDAGNGLGGILFDHLARPLNLEAKKLFWQPDGTYPHHVPNPNIPQNRQHAVSAAKHDAYDFSIIFDGDADRIVFLDEKGDFIASDFTGTLLADRIIQKRYPGSPVVIDLRRGWTLQESAQKLGYKPVISKAGTTFMKQAMRDTGATYGFEASAHNFYKDYFTSDSSGLTLILMLNLLEETKQPLSALVAGYRAHHFMTDEKNYLHHDFAAAFRYLQDHFAHTSIEMTDGLSLTAPDWHANIRPSNTEPLLRLNLETRDQTLLEAKFTEINDVITASGGEPVDH